MSVTQYIGARYVPLFADPIEWDNTRAYEPLTIVVHQGNSYTSRQAVPIGIDILNTEFWALTGNYNAQIEAYREEVLQFAGDIEAAQTTANEAKEDAEIANEQLTKEHIISQLQNVVFAPYSRYIFEDNSVTSAQVSTMDEDEQYFYVITPYAGVDQLTHKDSILRVIDPRSGELVSQTVLPMGHGRSLTVKNNFMLTSNQYAENNNEWVVISIANKTSPSLVSRGSFNGRHMFWTDEGAACFTNANSAQQIKFFDVTYDDNGIPVSFTENGRTLTLPNGFKGEEQSFQWWNGFIVSSGTLPETITILDGETGEIVAQHNLKSSYSFMRTQEIESAFIINNHLYFSNNGSAPQKNTSRNIECGLFRCDFLNPRGEYFDYWREITYQESRGSAVQYVSGRKPSISSVSSNGSESAPFWFVEDALVGWITDKRAKFSVRTRLTSSITFTEDEYDYDISLANCPLQVALIGLAGGNTTIKNNVYINNSEFILNRCTIDQSETDQVSAPLQITASSGRILNTCDIVRKEGNANAILISSASFVVCNIPTVEGTLRADDSILLFKNATNTSGNNSLIATTNNGYNTALGNNQVPGLSIAGSNTNDDKYLTMIDKNKSAIRLLIRPDSRKITIRKYDDINDLSSYTDVGEIPFA